jgi:hypothetical protein
MKIKIQRSSPSTKTGPVRVREKIIYRCTDCKNRYYSYHFFCPQCLGEVAPAAPGTGALRILACPSSADSITDLLKILSENQKFDFEKALQTLPWICMLNSDPAILQHWKECLKAQKIEAEIFSPAPPAKTRKRKSHPPLYNSNAPYPNYLPSFIIQGIRKTAQLMPQASAKLKWAETILLSFHILEGLYKSHTGRILFYDIIFRIEEQLREFLESYAGFRWSEAEFLKRNDKLKASFEQMAIEIQEVHQQVREQL